MVPEVKKKSFAELRNFILENNMVDLKTLQRFAGKCISFLLAIPSAKLYTREINLAIGKMSKNSKPVKVSGELRDEIQHWEFLDEWKGCFPWRTERHFQLSIATDASLYRWGTVIDSKDALGDYFEASDARPIHDKECDALFNTLCSIEHKIANCRVDAYVDNLLVVNAFGKPEK